MSKYNKKDTSKHDRCGVALEMRINEIISQHDLKPVDILEIKKLVSDVYSFNVVKLVGNLLDRLSGTKFRKV